MRWLLAVVALMTGVASHSLETQYSWDNLDYNFPNESMRLAYIASENFIESNNAPENVAVWRDKMFITVPRWRKGVPANLNYIHMPSANGQSPKLTPYPSWEANDVNSTSNDVIISIFRARVDACDRLWGVDMGVDDLLGNTKVVRPPRVVVIDLTTDQIIRTYALKNSDMKADSFIGDLVVDSDKDACDDAYAYLSDIAGFGLVVYSLKQNNSWRFEHNYLHFDPLYGDFNVTGINFHWSDGVFGKALSPRHEDGSKTLYFHAAAAIHEFSVSTTVLKNESILSTDYYHQFQLVGNKGLTSQGTSSAIDEKEGIIYFSQISRHGIACWNINVPLEPRTFHLITSDPEKLAFPNDVAVDPQARMLYVMMSNVPRLMYNRMDINNKYIVYNQSLDSLAHTCKSRDFFGAFLDKVKPVIGF